MNTKFFFLLLVSLLITTTTSSIAINRSEEIAAVDHTTLVETPTSQSTPVDVTLPHLPTEKPDVHSKEKSPLQPEDGKHHHFHFTRVARSKRKELVCFCCKFILAVGHIACLVYCILHAFH